MTGLSPPAVTVLTTIDYAVEEARTWEDFRQVLLAASTQDIGEPYDIVFVEAGHTCHYIPDGFFDDFPTVRRYIAPGRHAYDLIRVGVQASKAKYVATLDGDTVPDRTWLREILAKVRRHPDAAAVVGRTTYGKRRTFVRLLAVLQRAWPEIVPDGELEQVNNNNAIYLREALLKFPITNEVGAFGTALQGKRLRDAGYRLYYAPSAHAVHSFDGWQFERAVCAHSGFVSIRARQLEPDLRRGWVPALGVLAIPPALIFRTIKSTLLCFRVRKSYDLPVYGLALAPFLALTIHTMEIPGMWRALRHRPPPETAYR